MKTKKNFNLSVLYFFLKAFSLLSCRHFLNLGANLDDVDDPRRVLLAPHRAREKNLGRKFVEDGHRFRRKLSDLRHRSGRLDDVARVADAMLRQRRRRRRRQRCVMHETVDALR